MFFFFLRGFIGLVHSPVQKMRIIENLLSKTHNMFNGKLNSLC